MKDLNDLAHEPVLEEIPRPPKSAVLSVRLPVSLVAALKEKAKAKGMPHTHYIRMLLEAGAACQA